MKVHFHSSISTHMCLENMQKRSVVGKGGHLVLPDSFSGVLSTSSGCAELLAALGIYNLCMAGASASCSLLLSLAFASHAHREGNRGSTQVVLLGAVALPSPVSASAPVE